ncbi:hypothetical protein T08_1078 [Trichinella sp. T8]|nr:hypothetical protein T08_1078 [Trichinella sp. T8]
MLFLRQTAVFLDPHQQLWPRVFELIHIELRVQMFRNSQFLLIDYTLLPQVS